MKNLTLDEWREKGTKLFGKDIKNWRFKCPQCGGVQTYQDFIDNKIKDPDTKFYFSCIGRWVNNRGCDWTLGGLLQMHKTEVKSEDGESIPVFEFNE